MITLPDFKQKQVLFIQTEHNVSNKIKFRNDNIVFTKDDAVIDKCSCHRVFAVFIIGDISITSELIKKGREYGVSFFFLKNNFELYASINAAAEGNYLLKMRQYEMREDEELFIAKKIVQNKIENQLRLLKTKNMGGDSVQKKKELTEVIFKAQNQESLRGIEGSFSKEFFSFYFKPIGWWIRMPRVKPDTPNFLLDIGYTMMFNIIDALLRLYGFDTCKGCYHKLFFERRSLTCDIVEPFRAIIDKQVLKMHLLKQVNEQDFKPKDGNLTISFVNSQKYARLFLETIMDNKEQIYNYVRGFYRFVMNKETNQFPEFQIL